MKDKEKQIFDTSWKAKMVKKGIYKNTEEIQKGDKEKQSIINEMRDDVGGAFLSVEVDTIEKLYDKGYRKIKDSVVLSKEEYEKLKNENKTLLDSAKMMVSCFCDQQKLKEQASKETAEKVLKFFANAFPKEKGISSSHAKIHRAIEEISKELEIEIKE